MSERGDAEFCRVCGWREGALPESPLYLPPRTVLNDQYVLGRVLGYGGFGITYLAWDLNLCVRVAVKEYLPGSVATRQPGNSRVTTYSGAARGHFEYGLEKFIDEARALARFHEHPNVVNIINFFRANSTAYIVMTYLDGTTFKTYLEGAGGRIPYEPARLILMQVMDALRELHGDGLLHRDISPDNIYLTASSQVKLIDFGAARYAVGEQSQSLSMILKPGYAPEEQYRSGGKQGPWTDVYALGATLYRAVTGQLPPEALDRLHGEELAAPSHLGVEIPAEAEAALLKALAVRASDRFQDVASFQREMEPKTVEAPGDELDKLRRNLAEAEAGLDRAKKVKSLWKVAAIVFLLAAMIASVGWMNQYAEWNRVQSNLSNVITEIYEVRAKLEETQDKLGETEVKLKQTLAELSRERFNRMMGNFWKDRLK